MTVPIRLIVLLAVIGSIITPGTVPRATANQTSPLDLPALALTTADVQDAGYRNMGMWNSSLTPKPRQAAKFVDSIGIDGSTDDAQALRHAQATEYYILNFDQPNENSNTEFKLHTVLMIYANAEAAAEGHEAYVDIWSESETMHDVDRGLGQQVVLMEGTGTNVVSGNTIGRSQLAVQAGNVVFAIVAIDYANEQSPDIDTDKLQDLAGIQIDRITSFTHHTQPALSRSVLRLQTGGEQADHDRYTVLNGEPQCSAQQVGDEALCDAHTDLVERNGIVNQYYVSQRIAGDRYGNTPMNVLRVFVTEFNAGQASSYMANEGPGLKNIERLDIGDEAHIGSQTGMSYGHKNVVLLVRHDEFLVTIMYSTRSVVDDNLNRRIREDMGLLAEAQLACLDNTAGCDQLVSVPESMELTNILPVYNEASLNGNRMFADRTCAS